MKNVTNGLVIQEYMTRGVERVVSDALKATLRDPRESAFMLRFAAASRAAAGTIPPLRVISSSFQNGTSGQRNNRF